MSPNSTAVYSAPQLPAELSDAIIDYLRNDQKALRACSLVCRDWLPRARHNKLQTVVLAVTTCATFIKLLNRTPDIAACVKKVTLQYPPPDPLKDKMNMAIGNPSKYPSKLQLKTLATVFSRLSSVKILSVNFDIDRAFVAVFRNSVPRTCRSPRSARHWSPLRANNGVSLTSNFDMSQHHPESRLG